MLERVVQAVWLLLLLSCIQHPARAMRADAAVAQLQPAGLPDVLIDHSLVQDSGASSRKLLHRLILEQQQQQQPSNAQDNQKQNGSDQSKSPPPSPQQSSPSNGQQAPPSQSGSSDGKSSSPPPSSPANPVMVVQRTDPGSNQRKAAGQDSVATITIAGTPQAIPVYQAQPGQFMPVILPASMPVMVPTTAAVATPVVIPAGTPVVAGVRQVGTETVTQTSVLLVPANGPQVAVPVPAGQVLLVPGPQQSVTSVTVVPTQGPSGMVAIPAQVQQQPPASTPPTPPSTAPPASTESKQPPQLPQMPQQGPYCIPQGPHGFNVLAAGDSITQGSVPSKNLNHPYTIKLKQVLDSELQRNIKAVDAGLGGGGVFMTGFNVPTTFGPWLESYMAQGPWDVVVIMIGINDLLRGGRPADEIMSGLRPMLQKVLASNVPVILIPPFAAPGFVAENDPKEAERRKLAGLFKSYASEHAGRSGGMGPQVWCMDLQSGPFNFYPMSPSERSKWLDDGLHLTEFAYDTIGSYVAKEILSHMCLPPATNKSN